MAQEEKETKHQCCYDMVSDGSSWSRFHRCTRTARFERDGKWYCKTHDPVSVAEKRKEQDRLWRERNAHDKAMRDAENERRRIATHKAACFDDLLEALELAVEDEPDACFATTARAAIAKAKGLQ